MEENGKWWHKTPLIRLLKSNKLKVLLCLLTKKIQGEYKINSKDFILFITLTR